VVEQEGVHFGDIEPMLVLWGSGGLIATTGALVPSRTAQDTSPRDPTKKIGAKIVEATTQNAQTKPGFMLEPAL